VLKPLHRKVAKSWLKEVVSRSSTLHSFYNLYSLKKQKRLLREKISGSKIRQNLITRKQVVEEIRLRRNYKKSDICHVIGSGWSLNQSIKKIDANDFVIGFNYAAIADLGFDAYFFEFGGRSVREISENHLALARERLSDKTDLIYFKNIAEDKNDIDFILEAWISAARPVLDYQYVVLRKRNLSHILESCLNDRSDYLPQLCSTVMTAVFLAYQAGFKKIVIHGLDFGGQYFYQCMDRKTDPKFLPPTKPVSSFYGKTSKTDMHPTALSAIGTQDIVPILNGLLEDKGVALMCGHEDSPSSRYLPVYQKNELG
jgi:hypothetical protein